MPEYFFPTGVTATGTGPGPGPIDFDDVADVLQQAIFTEDGVLIFDDDFVLVQQGA